VAALAGPAVDDQTSSLLPDQKFFRSSCAAWLRNGQEAGVE
jgi:hypothetical protein